MDINLSAHEERVVGCLIEKEITTPDQYPLSLNALTAACNQKSNRHPVMELDDATVQQTLDRLAAQYLVKEQSGYGSRVAKYRHRFCNTEFGELKFSPQELAVVCELLLRGPQTPGELRSHAGRLCRLSDVAEVETALAALRDREDGPFVVCLAREPGRRESRWAHLLSGDVVGVDTGTDSAEVPAASGTNSLGARMSRLEERLAALEAEVAALKG